MKASLRKLLIAGVAGIGCMTAASSATAWESNDYEENYRDSRVVEFSAQLLREVRELERFADRAGYRDLERSADRFYRQAAQFYRGVDDRQPRYELENMLDDLERAGLSSLRREADRTRDRAARRQFGEVRRVFFVLKSEFENSQPDYPDFPDFPDFPDYRVTEVVADYGVTYFKSSTAQSSQLPYYSKCQIYRNQVISLEGNVRLSDGHIRVTLAESIPGCSFGREGRTGYIFAPHFSRY